MENTELEKLRKRLNELQEKEKLEGKIKQLENKMPGIEVPNPVIPPFPIQSQQQYYPPLPQSPQINQQREIPTTPERPIYPSVSGDIPHIMIGNTNQPGIQYTPQESKRMNNIMKWSLWTLVSLIVGYATWRIGSLYLG